VQAGHVEIEIGDV